MTTAETRDLEVDGPLWDSHPVNAEPDTVKAADSTSQPTRQEAIHSLGMEPSCIGVK